VAAGDHLTWIDSKDQTVTLTVRKETR
jgi:hypothetical protein